MNSKETVYNGYNFRSRTEARWAVFFDTLGVKYLYEHEDFLLPLFGRYLPDFYLPLLSGGTFAEVKGEFSDEETEFMQRVKEQTKEVNQSIK